MAESFTLAEFVGWLDALDRDVLTLYSDHRIWWGLNRLVGQNPAIGTPADLMNFITRSHFQAYLVGVRRVADQNCSGGSLWKLIKKVESGEIAFSREKFVSRYQDFMKEEASRAFDDLCQSQGSSEFPRQLANADCDRVKELARVVKPIVDQAIAHRDAAQPDPPYIKNTCEVLDEFMRLLERYRFLATGSSPRLRDYDPFSHSDVELPLRQAWMPEGSGFTFETKWPVSLNKGCQ